MVSSALVLSRPSVVSLLRGDECLLPIMTTIAKQMLRSVRMTRILAIVRIYLGRAVQTAFIVKLTLLPLPTPLHTEIAAFENEGQDGVWRYRQVHAAPDGGRRWRVAHADRARSA